MTMPAAEAAEPDNTAGTQSATTANAEEQALLNLHVHDPSVFEYAPWRATGRTGSERLSDLRKATADAQNGAEETGQQVTDQPDDLADVDDIDLDAPVGDAEGEVGEEAEETEEREPLAPWQPPKGEEVNEHVRPHLEALDTIAKDEAQRNEIVGIYQQMVEAQTTRLAELNKNAKAEMVSNLKAELGDGFAGFKRDVNAAFQGLPEELRGALRSARLPDGRLLMGMPEAVRMIHGLSAKQNRHADWRADEAKRGDRTHMLQQELAELDTIMNRDIDEYHRPWRNTGKSGSERRLELARELASEGPAKPSASDIRAEERELLRLRSADPDMYRFGNWRGSGRPAADRLHAIQAGRA